MKKIIKSIIKFICAGTKKCMEFAKIGFEKSQPYDGPNTWEQFNKLEKKYINIGAFDQRHPNPDYQNFVAVTVPSNLFQYQIVNTDTGVIEDNSEALSVVKGFPVSPPYVIYHDIRNPFPVPDNSVDGLHSEDCFEHIELHQYIPILNELYRILKPGCRFRLSVPDYNNPKDSFCLAKGFDPRDPRHVTLTTYDLLKEVLSQSKFEKITFLHYWDKGTFHRNPINYKFGYIVRTPDNDSRNTYDNPLHVTSIVVDLQKSEADSVS